MESEAGEYYSACLEGCCVMLRADTVCAAAAYQSFGTGSRQWNVHDLANHAAEGSGVCLLLGHWEGSYR